MPLEKRAGGRRWGYLLGGRTGGGALLGFGGTRLRLGSCLRKALSRSQARQKQKPPNHEGATSTTTGQHQVVPPGSLPASRVQTNLPATAGDDA
jgi:hypothetical protein